MRRITLWLVSTVSVLVLLFSYRTSTGGGTGPRAAAIARGGSGGSSSATTSSSGGITGGGTAGGSAGGGSAGGGSTGGTTNGSTNGGSAGRSTVSGTFTGGTADTQWGPVQVQITVKSGKITDIQPVQYPNNNFRDQEINSFALPVLHDEVLSAQSAQIDAVSGATITSEGYIASLQSALDAAHLPG